MTQLLNEFLSSSSAWGVLLTLAAFALGTLINRVTGKAVFNPLLLGSIFVIILLSVLNISYADYKVSAAPVSYLLLPATISLAIPLYEQIEPLKGNLKAIAAGIFTGVLTSLVCVLLLALLFGFNHQEYVTFLPKSITTAIGMGVSEELGGHVAVTVAVIIITGIMGNMLAEPVCRLFRITEPVAKGIAIGSASHAIGTTKAMEMGQLEGAMSSLSIALSGVLTVFAAMLFSRFL